MGGSALERVTVTIDSSLLSNVDGLVTSGSAKSRSHAFDLLLRKALAGSELKKALVLAGGAKEKLSAGGEVKPLLQVSGLPVLERILLHLKQYGIQDAVVSVGLAGEKIVSQFKNGENTGVHLYYVWEDPAEPAGSAGCLKFAQPYLPEPFLLTYSDVLYDQLDISDFYRFHRANGGLCTIALANSPQTKSFGVAKMSGARITDFSEKPANSQSNLINAGVAICEPAIFSFMPKRSGASFERDLLPTLAKKGKLFGYVYSGPWFDVGKPNGLVAARNYFAGK